MILRASSRRAQRLLSNPPVRLTHTSSSSQPRRGRLIGLGAAAGVLGVGTLAVTAHADSEAATPGSSLSSLMRSYLVYTLCSVSPLVNNSPAILSTCSNIPGLKEITEAVVRRTFFAQFVGGDSLPDTLPLISSVEAEEGAPGAQWKKNVEEILASVNFAGDFEDTQGGGRKTWVAVKLTALLPSPDSLKRMSTFLLSSRPKGNVSYPGTPGSTDLVVFQSSESPRSFNGLSEDDVIALRELYQNLRKICARAKERGIRLTVDAEHSWYQPGIDAFVLALSREFNQASNSKDSKIPQGQPIIYGTYQAYLRRTPEHIASALEDARKLNYALGVKLVRGAYHGQEIAYHSKRLAAAGSNSDVEDLPAVWLQKDETDRCFNDCARLLVGEVQKSFGAARTKTAVGLLFGTHNKESCQHVLDSMVASGLGQRDAQGRVVVKPGAEEAICFGQLYGMRDDLTSWIANSVEAASPMAFKYLPYGALAEVMPYLSRRAIENQSVLSGDGGAASERKRAGELIRKRILG
ncbi:proline dehydrogenase [Ceratobasidium sp. AG-Ba]|nr:proline dehydrogenase [Ceratobasidium sp. AG-Ba]